MARLSDTASTILAAAAQHENRRALPVPKGLRAPAPVIRKTLASLLKGGLLEEIPATRDDETWQHSETEGNTTLVITGAGLAAIGIEPETADKRDKRPARGKKTARGTKTAKKPARARTADSGGKSKQDIVIALLRRGNGASIEEMMAATGWLPHSVRGFMSGALKKRLGLDVVSEKDAKTGERRYFIAAIKSK